MSEFKDIAHKTVAELFDMLKAKEAAIKEMDEVIKLQDADLRKYEKQIEGLKAQLNNMEACYIEKKKQVEELHGKAQKALQEVSGASRFVNKDSAKDFDFLQGAVLRSYSRIEEALRGGHDSLTDARQKAEDQINNGARLTKHQIDL